MALVALGRLRTRRGDPGAAAALDEALELAEQTADAPAPGPGARGPRGGRLAGRRPPARAAPRRARRGTWRSTTGTRGTPASSASGAGRAGERVRLPACAARPFARQVAGDWRRAAALWERLGCPYERARALADGDEAAQRAALEIFDRLGARPDSSACASACAPPACATSRAARAPATRGNPLRPHRARGRDRRPARRRADQRRHRRAPAHLAQDGGPSRLGHPGQARRRLPRGSRPDGRAARADPRPRPRGSARREARLAGQPSLRTNRRSTSQNSAVAVKIGRCPRPSNRWSRASGRCRARWRAAATETRRSSVPCRIRVGVFT